MIEIALDSQDGNNFYGKDRPVFVVDHLSSADLAGYKELAKELITRFSKEEIVIVRSLVNGFSFNDFALALFIISCQIDNDIECAVFKVADSRAATSAYKPYVALTVAVKYIMRLGKESLDEVYKDISTLGYLGIDVKHDYINHKLFLSLPGKGDVPIIKADNITDILVAVGTAKALALLQLNRAFKAEITLSKNAGIFEENSAIEKVIATIKPLLK